MSASGLVDCAHVRRWAEKHGFKGVNPDFLARLEHKVAQALVQVVRAAMAAAVFDGKTIKRAHVLAAIHTSRTLPWKLVK